MLYRIFLLLPLVLSACQHREPSTISYDQLMLYVTQQSTQIQWTSKARRQSLGGVIPPSFARPLFGYNFTEAKTRVRILDIRTTDEFQKKNLTMLEGNASPVVNIPMQNILSEKELGLFLSSKNIETSSIILIVSGDINNAQKIANYLKQNNYEQVLFYDSPYK